MSELFNFSRSLPVSGKCGQKSKNITEAICYNQIKNFSSVVVVVRVSSCKYKQVLTNNELSVLAAMFQPKVDMRLKAIFKSHKGINK